MDLNTAYQTNNDDLENGSAQLAGAAPGLQIRCGALEPSRVGSIPMHFRHLFSRPIPSILCLAWDVR
jgi:hypothetical protein